MRTIIYLFIIALTLASCAKDEITKPIELEDETAVEPVTTSKLKSLAYDTDASGQVHIVIVTESDYGHHPMVSVDVPQDYVLVGGGAYVEGYGNPGALLTESYPDDNKSTWHAASKDHGFSYEHNLIGYAIGLKIDGLGVEELRNYVKIFDKTSGVKAHPNTSVSTGSGYKLIGGGAKINWSGKGNLLVHSYPVNNTWYAAGKDHAYSSPASITSYAIGIANTIPNFGSLDVAINNSSTYTNTGYGSRSINIDNGWVVSCAGARANYSGQGRLLTGII